MTFLFVLIANRLLRKLVYLGGVPSFGNCKVMLAFFANFGIAGILLAERSQNATLRFLASIKPVRADHRAREMAALLAPGAHANPV